MMHAGFNAQTHDHHACIDAAIKDAEQYCQANGLRLTPIRRRVLELIWQSHQPHGAYQVLEQLAQEGHQPSPPTVYRALDFLLTHGLIHKVNSQNAFVGCTRPGDVHDAQLFICDGCGVTVEQVDTAIHRRVLYNAAAIRFQVRRQTVEISGLCPQCAEHADV